MYYTMYYRLCNNRDQYHVMEPSCLPVLIHISGISEDDTQSHWLTCDVLIVPTTHTNTQ